MDEELLPIGRISKLAGISADTLRYYDDIGILKPAYISDESGYRYYAAGQAVILAKIRELKEYGFSLDEIKGALQKDEAALAGLYQKQYWILLEKKEQLQKTIDQLSKKIKP